ncbi:helix-turn-helix domain-containing protein [Frankia sp. Mgl5]|uniref:helix-turn-helix domain-containing protein n=1 Tax=Frankia sp. Mgl5 TaxID=2933793 RepID=UPI0020100FCD|nr:helix-turn-helix transcriptional regulator [Frankia sp. Mgl5]MCK9929995.1 helix-turn-helix domain-containing protein [Frankia sp. Mgl5]
MPNDVYALRASWGTQLRARRLERGLSLREAARQADISAPYLFALERGEHSPGDDIRLRLATTLGTTVGELFRYPAPEPIATPAQDRSVA